MKIGELAQATKISVRTLHHYDEIGLLSPSSRTDSSHRVYSESDIQRLHKITSLKEIGLSLDEIKQFIGLSQDEILKIINRHIDKTDAEYELLDRKKWCLSAVSDVVHIKQYQGSDILINIIRELTIQSQYFTKQERQIIQDRNHLLGSTKISEMHEKLTLLTSKAQKLMDQNVDPLDARVVTLANEWVDLGKQGTNDDPIITEKIKLMLKENPDIANYRGISSSLLIYLKTAYRSTSTRPESL